MVNDLKISPADMVSEKQGDLSMNYIKMLPPLGEGKRGLELGDKMEIIEQGGMARFSKSCTRLLR